VALDTKSGEIDRREQIPTNLWTQLLINALTGKVGPGTRVTGNPANQALALGRCRFSLLRVRTQVLLSFYPL